MGQKIHSNTLLLVVRPILEREKKRMDTIAQEALSVSFLLSKYFRSDSTNVFVDDMVYVVIGHVCKKDF